MLKCARTHARIRACPHTHTHTHTHTHAHTHTQATELQELHSQLKEAEVKERDLQQQMQALEQQVLYT